MKITEKTIMRALNQMQEIEEKYSTFVSTITITVETCSKKTYQDFATVINFNNFYSTLQIAEYKDNIKSLGEAAEKIMGELQNIPETIKDIIVTYELDDFKTYDIDNFCTKYKQTLIA